MLTVKAFSSTIVNSKLCIVRLFKSHFSHLIQVRAAEISEQLPTQERSRDRADDHPGQIAKKFCQVNYAVAEEPAEPDA